MKYFLKRVFIFLIPVLGSILCIEFYMRSFNSTYDLKLNSLIDESDKIEVLILGNSHAAFDVDPSQFDQYAFNLAQPAQSLYFDKRITLAHIDKLEKLKYVFVSVDHHSLYFSTIGIRDVWSYYTHKIEGKEKVPFASKYSYLHGYTFKGFIANLKSQYREIKSKKKQHIRALDLDIGVDLYAPINKGWYGMLGNGSSGMTDKFCKRRASIFNSIVKRCKEHDEIKKDFEDFIVQLKAKNITPIIITSPCYKPFLELLDKKIEEKNNSYLNEVCEKYKIEYWDYSRLDIDKNHFFNCDHLNKIGAARFSKLLNTRLEKLN